MLQLGCRVRLPAPSSGPTRQRLLLLRSFRVSSSTSTDIMKLPRLTVFDVLKSALLFCRLDLEAPNCRAAASKDAAAASQEPSPAADDLGDDAAGDEKTGEWLPWLP